MNFEIWDIDVFGVVRLGTKKIPLIIDLHYVEKQVDLPSFAIYHPEITEILFYQHYGILVVFPLQLSNFGAWKF